MNLAGETKRVLIVDDEPLVLGVLREFFASFQHGYKYEITETSSPATAFDILRRVRFDLILLDVVMPDAGGPGPWKQGVDLLKRLRELGVDAPVLMMTGGWGDEAKEAEALIEGAVGYLHKPFVLGDLDQAVTLVLGSG